SSVSICLLIYPDWRPHQTQELKAIGPLRSRGPGRIQRQVESRLTPIDPESLLTLKTAKWPLLDLGASSAKQNGGKKVAFWIYGRLAGRCATCLSTFRVRAKHSMS